MALACICCEHGGGYTQVSASTISQRYPCTALVRSITNGVFRLVDWTSNYEMTNLRGDDCADRPPHFLATRDGGLVATTALRR
jgi:hypothetical protein